MLNRLRAFGVAAALLLAALASLQPSAVFAQASLIPNPELCFQGTVGINGMIGVLGTITGGSGGTNGVYTNVPLTTGGAGTGATGNITVSGGAVTQVVVLSPGINYAVSDSISAASANIGGVTGFSTYVASTVLSSALAGGTAAFYIPGTLTYSQTWQNSAQTILNSNPAPLDSDGCMIAWGIGTYRVIVYDSLGNELFDRISSVAQANPFWAGLAGGAANAITVTDAAFSGTAGQSIQFIALNTNSGPATLNPSSYGNLPILVNSPSGPVPLVGNEIVANGVYSVTYDATLASFVLTNSSALTSLGVSAALVPVVEAPTTAAAYGLLGGAVPAPGGRLTLTSATPVLTSTVTGASAVLYTPYTGNQVPVWNGTSWGLQTFTEVSDSLGSTAHAPAAAVANSLYDEFYCVISGVGVLSRGPAWGSASARTLTLTRTQGFLTNSTAITNGCPAGYGLYVGTIATDTAAAAVTFAPNPAAASGGPTTGSAGGNAGAWLGVWNMYNRVAVTAEAQDSKSTWTYATATWRSADNSNNNRVTFVDGEAEDSIIANYAAFATQSGSAVNAQGLGLNSTTATSGIIATVTGGTNANSQIANYVGAPALGQTYLQAMEYSSGATVTYDGLNSLGQTMQIWAELKF